jgi:hypothetical protein
VENSEKLLSDAMGQLKEARIKIDQWNIGGGTVLAEFYNHRLSKDIDVFVDDPQLLARLSPRINSACDFATDYVEESQYIKLVFPEGHVDFIAGGQVSSFKPIKRTFCKQFVFISHPVEIIAKKIFFRGTKLFPRDLFDIACVYNSSERENLLAACLEIPDKIKSFKSAFLKEIAKKEFVSYSLSNRGMILPGGESTIGKEFAICKAFLESISPDEALNIDA